MTREKNSQKIKQFEETDADGGSSSQSGSIAFHDFVTSNANWRDDEMPFEEKKRMLMVHQDHHEIRVKAQKEKRDQYKQLKEGKINLQSFREAYGLGNYENARYKPNPILVNSAQFSGSTDKQVNQLPSENVADTNPELRNELRNELNYRNELRHRPAFNPKPRGPY